MKNNNINKPDCDICIHKEVCKYTEMAENSSIVVEGAYLSDTPLTINIVCSKFQKVETFGFDPHPIFNAPLIEKTPKDIEIVYTTGTNMKTPKGGK